MKFRKIGKALLFPHLSILLLLLPVSAVFLIYTMLEYGTEAPITIASYVLAAYTLTVWCFRIPYLIRLIKKIKSENKLIVRLMNDARLRVNISLYCSLIFNSVYALFQLWLGYYHSTFWFYSLGTYYLLLAVMRFFLLRYTARFKAGERIRSELLRYCACGWIFLIMNLALSLMVFFMVYWNRTFTHHEITTIAMAAYTFTAFTVAIVNIIKYRKYNSPVYSASKAISLATASVSMLTLTSTMLTTFGDGTMGLTERRILLGTIGGAVSLFVVIIAINMITQGEKKLKLIKAGTSTNE